MDRPRHRVTLEMHRHVSVGGGAGFWVQRAEFIFPFGKAHALRTAQDARKAALDEYAKHAAHCTDAFVVVWNGGRGRGEQVLLTNRKFFVANPGWK